MKNYWKITEGGHLGADVELREVFVLSGFYLTFLKRTQLLLFITENIIRLERNI